jgi:hypothetical protein
MFGLALRTYQRKVQRFEEESRTNGKTLWESVLEYIGEKGPIRRQQIAERFRYEDERAVSSVVNDLVTTGLAYFSGRGDSAVFGITSDSDRRALSSDDKIDALALLLWGKVFRAPGSTAESLIRTTSAEELEVRAALTRLLADGRVSRDTDSDTAPLRSAAYVIPVGDLHGSDAAVFDHFQAVCTAIAAKLRQRRAQTDRPDQVGGTTLHFGVHPGHPHEAAALSLLQRVRTELNAFWNEVAAYNREHPIPEELATRVTFYFGQVVRPPTEGEGNGGATDDKAQESTR